MQTTEAQRAEVHMLAEVECRGHGLICHTTYVYYIVCFKCCKQTVLRVMAVG